MESRVLVATWVPSGVVSTARPSPALTESRCPLGATVRPRGLFSDPLAVTSAPVKAVPVRVDASGMAEIRLVAGLEQQPNGQWR